MSYRNQKQAFTMVELIVVVIIMTILATIAFLSYGSFSSQARDSARLSDMSNLSESLEFYRAKVGSYPTPPNAVFNVTYSGAMVWYQGTIGDDFVRKLGASAGISKKPVDPLSGKEYIYSNVANGSAYQLKSDLEADTIALKKDEDIFIQTASASAGNPKISYIRGNYGGVIAKAQTGSIIYLLAVPSIISSTGSAGQTIEISSNSLSGYLLLNSQSNTTGIQYNPNKVVFTGTGIPSTDTNSGITNIMIAVKSTYSGTIIQAANPTVSQIIATPDTQLGTLGIGVISAQVGGSQTSTSSSIQTGAVAVNGICGSANGSSSASAPTTNLCNTGSASSVTGTGPWNWNCNGSDGGSNASCSANYSGINYLTNTDYSLACPGAGIQVGYRCGGGIVVYTDGVNSLISAYSDGSASIQWSWSMQTSCPNSVGQGGSFTGWQVPSTTGLQILYNNASLIGWQYGSWYWSNQWVATNYATWINAMLDGAVQPRWNTDYNHLRCIRASGTVQYVWITSGWGSCSASCGSTGTQTKTTVCKNLSDGSTVADSLCTGTKPVFSQSCSGQCSCNLPWGGTLANGQSTEAWNFDSNDYECYSQTRTCSSGTLSGSYGYASYDDCANDNF